MLHLILAIGEINFEGGIPMALFYAVFGFAFVFLGITLLILIFSGLGLVMKKFNARPKREKRGKEAQAESLRPAPELPAAAAEEELSPETVAAITAAIAAYLEGTKEKCDFVVRRIRKI